MDLVASHEKDMVAPPASSSFCRLKPIADIALRLEGGARSCARTVGFGGHRQLAAAFPRVAPC
jgi:hypothetical protein